MSRRIAALAACILVLTASTAVYAAEAPETVIEETGSGTSISITDITPREGGTDEAKGQLAYGSYYPVEIQTTEEDGIKLLVKTFVVPEGTSPQVLVEKGLTRRGIQYEVSDVLRRELEGSREQKTISQKLTLETDTNDREEILSLLKPSLEYRENGFSGTLLLDEGSVRAKVTDSSNYSYTLKDTREYLGLERNDPYYVPKTTEKNGAVLKLDANGQRSGQQQCSLPVQGDSRVQRDRLGKQRRRLSGDGLLYRRGQPDNPRGRNLLHYI